MISCPHKWAWLRPRGVLSIWQISTVISSRYETYFQWKTTRKSYVACRMAPVLVTLNDLEGHFPRSFPFAGLFECNPSHICAALYQISTDSVLAQSLSDSWAFCYSPGVLPVTTACTVCGLEEKQSIGPTSDWQ